MSCVPELVCSRAEEYKLRRIQRIQRRYLPKRWAYNRHLLTLIPETFVKNLVLKMQWNQIVLLCFATGFLPSVTPVCFDELKAALCLLNSWSKYSFIPFFYYDCDLTCRIS